MVRPTPGWTSSSCRTTTPRRTRSVGSGAAEFGISFQDSFTYAKAAGSTPSRCMAIAQHWTSADRRARRPGRHHQPARPRRQDLRRLRRRLRGAEDAGGDPRRGRERAVPERRARHGGVRGAVRRAGRLHRAVRDLGGHRGAAARPAAQDLRLHRLRLPGRLQRAADRQRHLAAGAPGPGAGVRAGRAARLPAGGRRSGEGRRAAGEGEPGGVHRAGAGQPQPADVQRALPARRVGRGRAADAGEVERLLRLPLRDGDARRSGRQAAHGAAGLRDVVHERYLAAP